MLPPPRPAAVAGGERAPLTRSRAAAREAFIMGEMKRYGVLRKSAIDSPSFQVLGVELAPLSERMQIVFCALGVIACHMVHGVLQELVVINMFRRRFALFIMFANFVGIAGAASLARLREGRTKRRIPLRYLAAISGCTTSSVALTFTSLRYLDYPTKTLFKSSRVLITMLFGVLFFGKKYRMPQWAAATMIITGLVVFSVGDSIGDSRFSPLGVTFLVVALCMEVCKAILQEYLLADYANCASEVVMYDNLLSGAFSFVVVAANGELFQAVRFMGANEEHSVVHIALLLALMSAAGFLGTSIVTAVVGRFGAVSAAMITTVRKASSIVMSYVIFPKPFSMLHFIGGTAFVGGLIVKSSAKGAKADGRATNKAGAGVLPKKKRSSAALERDGESDVEVGPGAKVHVGSATTVSLRTNASPQSLAPLSP